MEQRKHYEGRPKQHMAYGEYYTDGSAARKVVPMQPERTRHRSTDRQSAAVKNSAVPKKPMHRPSQPKMDPKKTHLEQQKQMQVEKRKQVNQKVAMRNREKALKIEEKAAKITEKKPARGMGTSADEPDKSETRTTKRSTSPASGE